MAETSSGVCKKSLLTEYSSSDQVCTYEMTEFAFVLDSDGGFTVFLHDLERPVLHVAFNFGVVEFTADKTLGVEDGVFRVGVESVLRSITN